MREKKTGIWLKKKYKTIYAIGYCELQHELNDIQPKYFMERAEGWACDIYELDSKTAISTGYDPIGISPSPKQIEQIKKSIKGL